MRSRHRVYLCFIIRAAYRNKRHVDSVLRAVEFIDKFLDISRFRLCGIVPCHIRDFRPACPFLFASPCKHGSCASYHQDSCCRPGNNPFKTFHSLLLNTFHELKKGLYDRFVFITIIIPNDCGGGSLASRQIPLLWLLCFYYGTPYIFCLVTFFTSLRFMIPFLP